MNDRVQLRVATLLNTGVVAETSRGFLIVAMDSFSWLQLSHEDAMCADIKPYSGDEFIVNGAASVTGVVDFSYTETVKPVATGMLTGVRDQTILNGQMPSYYAHYAKPALIADNNRLRSGNQLYTEKTFSCGDVLYWCGDSTGMTRASVLRVLYKPHTRGTTGRKREQTRKLLILVELFKDGEVPSPHRDPVVFPASWSNWARLPLHAAGWGGVHHDSTEACALSVSQAALTDMEMVRLPPLPCFCPFVGRWVGGGRRDNSRARSHR